MRLSDKKSLIAGIRYLSLNPKKPFISIWPDFEIGCVEEVLSIGRKLLPIFSVFNPLYESYANLRMQVCSSFPTSQVLVGSKENPQTFRAVISLGVYSGLADPILLNFSNS